MARCGVEAPNAETLRLKDGDWIQVKRKLNAGEAHGLFRRMRPTFEDGKTTFDLSMVGFAKPLTYLLGWSFVDLQGKPLPYSIDLSDEQRLDLLKGLPSELFAEITQAIDAHEAALEQAAVALKKTSAGEPNSSAISTSAA